MARMTGFNGTIPLIITFVSTYDTLTGTQTSKWARWERTVIYC